MMEFSVSNFDRHLTDEQLTALLDDQFLPGESLAEYRQHLRSCAQCQGTLGELRQTVTLLHSLPQPALPRSFALPLDTTLPEPVLSTTSSPLPVMAAPVIPIASRRRQRSTFLSQTLRLVAVLIAAIGILLMLSGLLPSLISSINGGSYSAASSSNTSGSSIPYKNSQSATDSTHPSTVSTPPPGNQSRPSLIQPKPTKQPASQAPPASNPPTLVSSLSTFNTMGNRIGLGILIFFLGAICFTLFRQR
jgi:hypothetical protein